MFKEYNTKQKVFIYITLLFVLPFMLFMFLFDVLGRFFSGLFQDLEFFLNEKVAPHTQAIVNKLK